MSRTHGSNVLVVSQSFEGHLTGWGKHTVKLLDSLSDRGTSFTPFLLTSRDEVADPDTVPVSDVITTPFPYGEGIMAKTMSGFAIIAYFLASFRKWNVVYCSNFYFPVPLLVLLAGALGQRTVVRIAGQEVTATGWRGRLRDAASRRADAIVALNSAVRDYLVDIGVSEETIHQIPNAVDTSKYAAEEYASEERSSEFRKPMRHLLCVAAVCERKGVHHVVEAMAQLRDRTTPPVNLHLTVVGPFNEAESAPSYTERLIALIESRGLENDVEFTGRVEEVAPYYRQTDAFVLPSYEEGMPNVLLEAMASQLPCIATAIPGVVDVVTHEDTALLVEPKSDEDIAGALHRLVEDENFAANLGERARDLIEKKYSLQTMARSYRNLIVSQARYEK